ncbi:MAG: hypothetical protein M1834_008906 [Cirrosporium novae-zelandiae]|nr:MAG: hypothetical protein M1834_008906 [Cirrosporium novae-zelandiae]
MRAFTTTTLALGLSLAATTSAQSSSILIPTASTAINWSLRNAPLRTAVSGALEQTSIITTAAPTSTSAAANHLHGIEAAGSSLTVTISNLWSVPLYIVGASNVGVPAPTITPSGTLAASATTMYRFPTGWAGNMALGKTSNAKNSLIEISFVNAVDIDISYVNGYSVAITCSCVASSTVIAGCSKALFALNDCPSSQLESGPLCLNGAPDAGPAETFFAPCEGLAYTYPYDNTANYGNGKCASNNIQCCVGRECPASSAESKKRDLGRVERRKERYGGREIEMVEK